MKYLAEDTMIIFLHYNEYHSLSSFISRLAALSRLGLRVKISCVFEKACCLGKCAPPPPGMGKTVLLQESVLSVPVTITNRLFDSFYIRSRVYTLTLYGGAPLRRFRCERGIRSRGDEALFVCVFYLRDYFCFMLNNM